MLLTVMVGFVVALANASPAAAAGSCTDSWLGGSADWFVSSKWSTGAVPGPNDAVCITAPGDYTVTVSGGPAGAGQAVAESLQLGGVSGTQKLVIEADNSCGDSTGAGELEVYDSGVAATAASVGVHGPVELTQNSNTCSGVANAAYLKIDNGVLANAGLITADTGGVASSAVTGRLLQGSIDNGGGGSNGEIKIEANTTWSGATFDNAGGLTFARDSVLTIPANTGATFINDGDGTITNNGSPTGYLLADGGNTFQQGAGTANPGWSRPGANPAVIVNGATLAYTANGISNIEIQGQATLVGDVPSNALLAIDCSGSEAAALHTNSFTNAGFIGLYGPGVTTCKGLRTLSVDSGAGPGTGTLTNTGEIQGYGTIAGNVDNTTGNILPGDSFFPCSPCWGDYTPGVIAVTGNYAQASGGTLGAINANYCSPCSGSPGTAYSQLSVSGDASVAGRLEMLTGSNIQPAAGDAYQVLTARSVTGTFATLDGQLGTYSGAEYVPVYHPTDVTVDVAKLPKLTVTRAGTGSGAVDSSPPGISCGATCSAFFSEGQAVTLTATPAKGSEFAGWSGGGCSGTGTCTVAMNVDQTVTATYTPVTTTSTPVTAPSTPALSVKIRSALARVLHGHTKIKLACVGGAAASTCHGTLSLTIRKRIVRHVHHRRKVSFKTIVLARASYTVASGKSRSINLRLTPAGRRRLAHARHHRLKVRATATLTGGRNAHRAIILTPRPPKQHKR